VYSNAFQLVLGLIVLAGCLAVVIVGAAAIALPYYIPKWIRGPAGHQRGLVYKELPPE
jgi:hypothetical protein